MKIGQFLRIPQFVKTWSKRLAIVFGVLFFILGLPIFLYGYFFGHEGEQYTDWTLQHIVNSVLEIPYLKRDFVIDRPEYIKTLTPEEWMNVKCKVIHKRGVASDDRNYGRLSEEEKWHLNCISPQVVSKFEKDKTVNGELCSNYYNCQLLSLAVGHYVFQYPEILWNIIKIAERPCDFIKTFDKKVLDNPGDQRSIISDAKYARHKLCSSGLLGARPFFAKSRKFVLITIQDIENKRIMDIIVRRKDID